MHNIVLRLCVRIKLPLALSAATQAALLSVFSLSRGFAIGGFSFVLLSVGQAVGRHQ